VLSRFVGSGPIEVGKAIGLVVATVIAVIALQQLAVTRSSVTSGEADRAAVLSLARSFGQALTTYDYAHPDVQVNNLSDLAARPVVEKVRRSFPDLAIYQAVSVGEVPDVYLQILDPSQAQVLVRTRSTVQSRYTPPGTRTTGLLVCDIRRSGSGWRVTDYRWLTPVAESVS
jgi:hypothetical protein